MKYLFCLLLLVPVLCLGQTGFAQPAHAIADTSSLKTMNVGDGGAMFIAGYTTSTSEGAGWYIVIDSTYEEGTVAFNHPTAGKQWASIVHINSTAVFGVQIGDSADALRSEWRSDIGDSLDVFDPGLVYAVRSASAQSITNNSITTIVFDTETYDESSQYNNTTGIFTAAADGYYLIEACVGTDETAMPPGTSLSIYVSYNTVALYQGDLFVGDSTNYAGVRRVRANAIIKMDEDDTARIRVLFIAGKTLTVGAAGTSHTYLNIIKIR